MITASEAIGKWKVELKEESFQKFSSQKRTEYLESLMGLFLDYGVDFESAKAQKRKVVEILSTKDGRKGVGKHKGWSENIEDEFIAILLETYPQTPINHQNNTFNADFIICWISHKLEQPEMESFLQEQFKKDVMMSDWVNGGDNVPEWAKQFYIQTELRKKPQIEVDESGNEIAEDDIFGLE